MKSDEMGARRADVPPQEASPSTADHGGTWFRITSVAIFPNKQQLELFLLKAAVVQGAGWRPFLSFPELSIS